MIRRDRVSKTWQYCHPQYLRTAILGLAQYPADGIRETSNNNFALCEGNVILLVDRYEKGGTIIPVANNNQFDGVGKLNLYLQIENVIPRNVILFLPCVLRRQEPIAYGKLDVVLLREPEFRPRLGAKFDV